MDQLIDESVAVFLSSAKIKGIELIVLRPGISSKVLGDRSMIRSVLRNLLNNAIKFCSDGDKITLSIDLASDELTVKIIDTGEGMEPEILAQFPLAERAARALGMTTWSMVEFEADDALATAAVATREIRVSMKS